MPRSRLRLLGVGAAALGGAAGALQSKVNGDLAERLGSGLAATLVSFAVGLTVVGAVALASPTARRGLGRVRTALRRGRLRPWQLLGGVCSGFVVTTQGLTVGTLGVAIFTVAAVAGQSSASLLVDRAGLGPAGPQPVTAARTAGAALTVLAVVVAVAGKVGTPSALALAVLPLAAGCATALQQAVNGHVQQVSESSATATLVNFVLGTVCVVAAFAVATAIQGWPSGALPREPWLYLGGVLGACFVAISAAVVRHIGVLLLALATVAGQLIAALVIDEIAGPAAGWNALLGVGLTLVAVLLAARTRPPRTEAALPGAKVPTPPQEPSAGDTAPESGREAHVQ